MLSNVKLILYGIAVAAILSAGIYARHIYKEAQRVDGLVQTINVLNQQKAAEREQNAEALRREHDLQKKLAAAHAGSVDLARRLRHAYTARLPKASPFATEPVGTPGAGVSDSEIDAAVAGVVTACKADSIRLQGWQSYYDGIPAELK